MTLVVVMVEFPLQQHEDMAPVVLVAIAYIAIIFYALPFAGVWLTRGWNVATFYEPTVPQEVENLRQESSTEGANDQNQRRRELLTGNS